MSIVYFAHPSFALHEMGPQHPERPARLAAINDRLIAGGLDATLQHIEAPLATRAQLHRAHDPAYVDAIFRAAPTEDGYVALDPDTSMNRHTLYAALHAAGAVVKAVELVAGVRETGRTDEGRQSGHEEAPREAPGEARREAPGEARREAPGEARLQAPGEARQASPSRMTAGRASASQKGGAPRRAFCAVRPPGHHACFDRAMGFCFFNNVAIGAAHAIEAVGLKRVAIVDFDVHHGNGTENIVLHKWPAQIGAAFPVLFCSTFQYPFYPYSGADTEAINVVNVPLPALTNGPSFRRAIEIAWLPALEAFGPELILVSAGFDGHAADPMAQWLLQESDFAWVTEAIVDIANRHAGGHVVSVLEGGYDLRALAQSVEAHLRALV